MAERKRGGRPPLSPSEPSTAVSLKLTVSMYDCVYQTAVRRRQTVPDLIRGALARALRDAGLEIQTPPKS